MIIETLKSLFNRDLNKLKAEIAAYVNEDTIWVHEKQILNSAGNLCLHLIGNLNNYIGAGLGKTGYIRNRELEFSQKNVPKAVLLQMITDTMVVVDESLSKLTKADLETDFPMLIWGKPTNITYTLTHLVTHLNYHLGQINYHRRLLDDVQ